MKAKLQQLSIESANASFLCYTVKVPTFEFQWHYHPEYELTYIVKGRGKRYIGDSYQDFDLGDLVLLFPMLAHTWVSETSYQDECEAIVVQFSNEFIETLFQYPEMSNIRGLFLRSKNGLHFNESNKKIILLLKELVEYKGVYAFTNFIKILHHLSDATSIQLSSDGFKLLKGNENQHRINKVLVYIQQNYARKVLIGQASDIVHLSESAFCKFFKRVTGRTFSDYVNEIRISKACELIIETDKPIEQIAYETGFESQTYFNRVFLRKKEISPKKFRSSNK